MKKELHPDSRPSFLPRATTLHNRYRIVKRLGSGGMGAVYEAVDLRLNTRVALKETFSSDPRLRRQFAREAQLLARLDHPALPRVSDYFTDCDRAFIVMQFIPGPDLADIMVGKPRPFSRHQVIAWADQLLDALIYLHAPDRRIVHRDIKPHNLKLKAGQIALLDFGLAKSQVTGSINSHSSLFGFTPRYSPPEQIQDRGTTPQSDIYALGATLYHLVTGVKPPDALIRAMALAEGKRDPLLPAHEAHPDVGPDLAAILHRAMCMNAADRYSSASKFRDALRRVDRPRPIVVSQILTAAPSQVVNSVTVNTTVVRKARRALVHIPLENHPVPEVENIGWLLPEPSRAPLLTALVSAVMLLVMFLIGSEVSQFAGQSALEFAKTNAVLTASDKRSDQNKSYRVELKNSKKVSGSLTSREANQKNDKAKRTSRR
jgi:serine/threonine protein kinase